MKEALLYDPLDQQKVKCRLCHHRCLIKDGRRGICGVRENRAGVLNTLVYGQLIARHVDPIEKKPIFHLIPGSLSYSIATVGCNFKCRFCQNADIAQMPSDQKGRIMGDFSTPETVVASALSEGCQSIAYTYTEPTVYFEFAWDTARLAQQQNIKNIFVTNGYMTQETLAMVAPYLDAANVDLKAFNDEFYKSYCGARLANVKDTLVYMKSAGIFVEVTTLLIPGLNDDIAEIKDLAGFLVEAMGPETPWHISRFHPTYKLVDRSPTPVETLAMARDIGIKAGLRYVYTGNVPGNKGENTFCYGCHKLLIERWGFRIRQNFIQGGCCPYCGLEVDGIEMNGNR